MIAGSIARSILPDIEDALTEKQVELRGCERTRSLAKTKMTAATEEDWYTEYVGPILAIKIF